MKTWEMFSELTENQEKQFKRLKDGLVVKNINGKFVWDSGYYKLSTDDEWEEVEQPLTFKEVLEKAKEDVSHKFRVEHEDLEGTDFSDSDFFDLGLLVVMLDAHLYNRELARVLLEGKFYMKEKQNDKKRLQK